MSTIFTKILNGEIDGEILYEDNNFFAIFDINPKTKGHTLLITKGEYETLMDVPNEVVKEIMVVGKQLGASLIDTFDADGIKYMQNNGKTAGQEVPHFHLHIIPFYEDASKNKDKKDFNNLVDQFSKAIKDIEKRIK
jgi:histidine triad (HIT) family protein